MKSLKIRSTRRVENAYNSHKLRYTADFLMKTTNNTINPETMRYTQYISELDNVSIIKINVCG